MGTVTTTWKDPNASLDSRMMAADQRVSAIAGVLNTSHGALIDLVADSLDDDLWGQWGVHTPAHWLAWKSGMAKRHAHHIVMVAARRDELPTTVAAVRDGRLSLDQARAIAAYVPAEHEASAAQLAIELTVGQLERILPSYAWGDGLPEAGEEASDDHTPNSGAEAHGTSGAAEESEDGADESTSDGTGGADESDPENAAPNGERDPEGAAGPGGSGAGEGGVAGTPSGAACKDLPPFGDRARAYFAFDDHGFGRLSALLPPDVAIMFETALKAARDMVFQREAAAAKLGEAPPRVSTVDALAEMAAVFLAAGVANHPGATRFRVFAHLDAGHDGNRMRSHLGPVLPDRIRQLLSCDSDITPVWERHGNPMSVGRALRVVNETMRKLIQHRDGGCRVPGCERQTILDVHHIVHWEDGGSTDTDNLVTLCRKHHRLHHVGLLGIAGNPEITDPTDPNGLRFTDKWNRPLRSAPTPSPPKSEDPAEAAEERGIYSASYPPPTHERLRKEDVILQRANPTRAGPHAA